MSGPRTKRLTPSPVSGGLPGPMDGML